MGSVVRAGIHATGFLVIGTKVAPGGLVLHHRHFALRSGVHLLHGEGVHVDVAVRAILGAQPTADTPVFNGDLQRIAAADGTYRAPDHTERIAALAA